MSRQRRISAKAGTNELTVHDHETDFPIIPIAQIERLHNIRPDKVDWIFSQSEVESLARRKEAIRINTFVFIERLVGTVFAFLIALFGIGGSIWLAYQNHEKAASIIGGVTLVGMVSAFIYYSKKKE